LSKVVLNIPAAGFTQPFDANTGLSGLSSPLTPATIASLFGGNENGFLSTTSYFATQSAGTQSLSASAYGIWGSNDGFNASRIGGFAIGSLTPSASVPTTGSATFNGSTVAISANDVNTFVGSAQIIANFSANTVTANLTNFSGQGGATLPNLTGIASISGNAYAGSISGTGLTVTGTINGNFYGSAAQETAGVWQIPGLTGSYGAK
jgi:hypothetical protein